MDAKGFDEFKKLPPQKIGAFRVRRSEPEIDDSTTTQLAWKLPRMTSPTTGSDSQVELSGSDSEDDSSDKRMLMLLEGKTKLAVASISQQQEEGATLNQFTYMKNSFIEDLIDNTVESFFKNPRYVKIFGKITQIKMRFGLDHINKVAKLYIKRNNFAHSNPSILQILWSDIEEIRGYLDDAIIKINEGIKQLKPIMKPDVVTNYIPDKPIDQEFWTHDSCFYTESGNFQCRMIWNLGNVYSFYFNLVKEGKVYETEKGGEKHYTGPKIRLVKTEVEQFIGCLDEIRTMVPDEKVIQTYINKIK